jgi:hypothetical protein
MGKGQLDTGHRTSDIAIAHCPLPIAHRPLPIAHRPLPIAHRALPLTNVTTNQY